MENYKTKAANLGYLMPRNLRLLAGNFSDEPGTLDGLPPRGAQ
jgi:hypothetical protein